MYVSQPTLSINNLMSQCIRSCTLMSIEMVSSNHCQLSTTHGIVASNDIITALTCAWCVTQTCYSPSLGGAWLVTLSCVLMGSCCVTTTIVLLVLAHCYHGINMLAYARWVGFTASQCQTCLFFEVIMCYKLFSFVYV